MKTIDYRKMEKGDCYESAMRHFLELHENGEDLEKWKLGHGEVTGTGGEIEGVKYGHGWMEKKESVELENFSMDLEMVFDKSNGKDIEMPKALYYHFGNISSEFEDGNIHEYSYKEALRKLVEHGHWGPWDLETSTGF